MKILLAEIIKFIHLAMVAFILFGWLSPGRSLLLIHVILIPTVVLQWRYNDGTCLLTNLELFLRGDSASKTKSDQQGQFTKRLLAKCFDPLPTDEKIKRGLYMVVWGSFSISLLRLLFI